METWLIFVRLQQAGGNLKIDVRARNTETDLDFEISPVALSCDFMDDLSQGQLSLAEELANKFECNIIGFHEHHLGVARTTYGNRIVVNAGCLADPNKLAYVCLDDSAGGGMPKGFCMLKRGFAYLFGDHEFTDYDAWL